MYFYEPQSYGSGIRNRIRTLIKRLYHDLYFENGFVSFWRLMESFSFPSMVLILDSNSYSDAHACKKTRVFGRKKSDL